jgi:peptidyl-tRNA hydrolase, PTH1 family
MTRHNAGFWIIDQIATKYGAAFNRSSSLNADLSKTTIDGESVVLAKPLTYMNLSGRAVQSILHWYKIPVENCIIVHDDVSLPLGKIRFQQGGGAGGQHGIESIIEMLGGNKGFDRLKFGVGPDPGGDRRADYVLSPVPQSDQELREQVIATAAEGLLLWLRSGLKIASNKYNGMDLRPKPPEPEPAPKPAAPKEAAASASSIADSISQSQVSDIMGTAATVAVVAASGETPKPGLKKPTTGSDIELNQVTIVSADDQADQADLADFNEEEELEALPPPEF